MKKKTHKRIVFLSIIGAAIIIIIFSDTYIGRYIRWNLPDVYDLNKFPYEVVGNSDKTLTVPKKENNPICKLQFELKGKQLDLNELVDNTSTYAFLIMHNDTIVYEKYAYGKNEETLFKLYSATKSVLSGLIGIAIDEGKIKSVDEPIKNYVTGFRNKEVADLSIKHFLNETTGIKYNTSYMPWGGKPKTYYKPNIRRFSKKVRIDRSRIGKLSHSEHNTNILGIVLENATHKKIYDYLSEKIWVPAGMNYQATFSVDSKKNKLACVSHGLNATATDFLIFGKLFLDKGFINGKQIISEHWIEESTSYENGIKTKDFYKNYNSLWWLMRNGGYFANGHFGQRLFISPKTNTVIVRLGEKSGGISWEFEVFPKIIEELNKKGTQHAK